MSTNAAIHRDLFWAVCGEHLGRGISRTVYACVINPAWVIKVEDDAGSFQNILEWEIWNRVRDTAQAKWFAPCHFISPNGSILIQSRTTPARDKEFATRMPIFFTDFKRSNYGLLGRKFVCHDYGTALALDYGVFSTKMRTPKWWD